MKEEFEMFTKLPIEEIEKNVLKLINTPFRLLFFIKKKQYSGSFKGNTFKIQNTSTPPVELKGVIIPNEKILITVSWESMRKAYKGLIYAFMYPAVSVIIFLLFYYYPSSFLIYFLSFLLLFVPVFIYYWFRIFHIEEPNPDKLIKDVKKLFG